jgi:cytochrome c553
VIASGPYKDKRFYEVGQQLFRSGDPARDVPACMGCHGPTGAGNPGPAYPALAGQQAAYVKRRLEDYRALGAGVQKDPLIGMMAGIAGRLTDEEVGALASYVQGLHPRADDVAAEAASTAAR